MNLRQFITLSLLLLLSLQGQTQALTTIQLKDSITAILEKSNTPGAFVRVVTNDSILFQSEFGYTDLTNHSLVNQHDLFAMGSISKTFTALAILKLIKEGKLNLEDELKVIAPQIPFTNHWEDTHPVKIKHLLSHRSGFDDMHISRIIKKRSGSMTALEEVMVYDDSYKTNWKPGLVFSYSNPGYIILGYIIEKISGMPFQTYIKNNILQPLQMNQTSYYSVTESNNLKIGFQRSKEGIEPSDLPRLIGESAGGLLSTGTDMSKFVQFLLKKDLEGSVTGMDQRMVREMEKFHSKFEVSNNINTGYSLGMYDRHYGSENIEFKGHNGSINGFSSDYIYNRDMNIGIVVSSNMFQKSNGKIMDLLVDQFVENSNIISSPKSKEVLNSSKFNAWEGRYKMLSETNNLLDLVNAPFRTLKIQIEDDSISLTRFMSDKERYNLVGDNLFKEGEEVLPTLILCNNDNEKALVLYEDTFVKINPVKHYLSLMLLIFGLFSGIVVTMVAIVQLFIFPFKRTIGKLLQRSMLIGAPFWLILGSLGLYLSNSSFQNLDQLGTITIVSISLFIATVLFPLGSIYGGYKLFKNPFFDKNRWLNGMYLMLFVGITFLSLYCISFGWFALRLWS